MKPPRIHIGALHCNRLPRLIASKLSQPSFPTEPQEVEVSRRHLLGMAAVAGVGMSPAVKMVETVLASAGEAFEPTFTKNRVAFSQNGQERWVIDTQFFSGYPRLTYVQSKGLITLELRHALFPGTLLPADFSCSLTQQTFGWEMELSFSLGGFRCKTSFDKWLAGLEPARAPVWLDDHVCELKLGRMTMAGRAAAEFFPHWVMSFRGEGVGSLQGSSTRLDSDMVQLALLQPTDPSVVRRPGRYRTLVAMDRGTNPWSMKLPVDPQQDSRLHAPVNAFSMLHIEAWEHSDGGKAHALIAESGVGDEPLSFCCDGLNEDNHSLVLGLSNVRYVSLSDSRNRQGQQALVAKFGETQDSVSLHGCSFTLGHPMGTPPFELIQYEDGARTLRCEPGINRLAVPLAGALVQPMEVPFGARLILAQTKPRKRLQIKPKPKRPAIRVPSAPPAKQQSVVPNNDNSGSQSIVPVQKLPVDPRVVVPLINDFRATIQIPGPLALSVVRPEDLLVLKFEFRNLNLQIGQGQPPKLVPATGGKSRPAPPIIIVNFPPQHIAEETFYEAAESKDPPTFPIDARLAGWSRLVFALPNGTTFIPYTLDALLNWSHFQQVVAPSAAPPPPPPKRFRLKVPVKPGLKKIPRLPLKRKQSFPFLDGPIEPRWNEVRETLSPFQLVETVLKGDYRPQAIMVARKNAPNLKSKQAIQSQIPNVQAVRIQPPSPPTPVQLRNFTALEVPYRLFLSPSAMAGWSHMAKPVVFNGRTELWHTRLGVRKKNRSGAWGVDESDTWYRTMRAIWSPDFDKPNQGGPQRFPSDDPDQDRTPFRMLPEAQHRHQLVHLMANGKGFPKGWQDRVMKIDRFMLSALGAWIKSKYLFDPAPNPLTVIEWVQHANMGRDQFVKVVEQGFLFPFGHKAVLVAISERKFERTKNNRIVALLRYREFIVVREPIKEYPGPGQEDLTFSDGRNFPYRSLQITNLVTPNLDKKEQSSIPWKTTPPGTTIGFWPKVTGEDFQWHVIGKDWAGQTSEFSIPLIFITTDVGLSSGVGNRPRIHDVRDDYTKGSASRNVADLAGQKVAFGPTKPSGDTVLETASLTFDAEIPCHKFAVQEGFSPACSSQILNPLIEAVTPLFYPFVSQAEVSIPAVKSLLGTGPAADRTKVRYSNLYRVKGFGGANKGELFLELIHPVGLKFGQTDKVGGVGAPNLDIVGISRKFGPIGGGGGNTGGVTTRGVNPGQAAEKFAQGNFDPTDFFKDASILGGIDLGLILKGLGMDKAPKLVTDRFPEEMRTTFTLDVAPKTLDLGIIAFKNKMGSKAASLLMSTTITVKLPIPKGDGPPPSSEPQFDSRGELQNFELSFAGQLILRFKKFLFVKKHGKKLDVAVELAEESKGDPKGVEFGGALAFLAKMQELIPADGLSDPPSLEVTGSGVAVSLSIAIPSVTVGVLSLTNMKFGAALRLPFTGDPVTLRINFCSRNDPFMGAVWIFGLTGFFAVEMNGKEGLALVEVQIEFGGMWAIDIGVASGSIKLVAGFYFKYVAENKAIELEGYIKVQGCVQVLGIVTISILVKLALSYSSVDDVVWGEALLQLKVEVLFFEVAVEWKCRKELAGSSSGSSGSAWLEDEEESLVRLVSNVGRPHQTARSGRQSKKKLPNRLRPRVQPRKIHEMVSEQDWNQYASAFAADGA